MNLNDNEKHWLVVGLALVKVLVPNIRSFLDNELQILYESLKAAPHKIHEQLPGSYLPRCLTSNINFNYHFINRNYLLPKHIPFNYRVESHVDLAKLYLKKSYMTNFTAINDECDPSAALNLVELVPAPSFNGQTRTRQRIKEKAKCVRETVRNCWAHCNLNEWNRDKFDACFKSMSQLLVLCKLTDPAKDLQRWRENEVEEIASSAAAELRADFEKWKTEDKEEWEVIKATLERLDEDITTLKRGQEKGLEILERIEKKIERQPECMLPHAPLGAHGTEKEKEPGCIDIAINCSWLTCSWSCGSPPSSTSTQHQVQESSTEKPVTPEIITDRIAENVIQDEDNGFCDRLKELGGYILRKWKGSLMIKVQCKSLEILQRFWDAHKSGRLNKIAEKCLVTRELLDRFSLKTVKLQTTISTTVYTRCRRELIAIELDIKDCCELENVIEEIERLIDMNDLPAALQLIRDKKKEKLQGPKSIFEFLLDSGAEVDHKTKDETFPLMIAAYQGSHSLVKIYLDGGAEVNKTDLFGRTALHVASRCGHVDVVNVLVERGANLELPDKFGNTPLQLAKQKGNKDVKTLLKSVGAKEYFEPMNLRGLASEALLKIDDQQGYNLLHLYCKAGDRETIKRVLYNHLIPEPKARSCREIISELDNEGQKILQILDEVKNDWENLSELHKAAQQNDVEEVVSLVVDQSMNVNTLANRNESALHWASVNGSADVVSTLIELGSDISAQTDQRLTSFHKACLHNNCSVADLLMKRKAELTETDDKGQTPLHVAAQCGNMEVADLICKKGKEGNMNLDLKDSAGRTPLHRAAENNFTAITSLLLSHNANTQAVDNKGQSPLHVAARYGKMEVADLICEKGKEDNMNLELKDMAGRTPLHRAAENNFVAITSLLLSHNANTQAVDDKGQTPLHLAAAKGNVEILETLLASTSSDDLSVINVQDNLGFTPLHRAVENNRTTVVQMLLDAKAAVDIKTKQNLADRIYLVQGQCDGKETWMYLFVHKYKMGQFKKIVERGNVSQKNFREFGHEILAGYGKKPSKRLREYIEREAANFSLDNADETPLHLACRKGHNEIVRLLYKANREMVYQSDAEGFLPFHTAIMYGNSEAVIHFLECSQDLTTEPVWVYSESTNKPKTMTPVDLAEANNEVGVNGILKRCEKPDAIPEKSSEEREREIRKIVQSFFHLYDFVKKTFTEAATSCREEVLSFSETDVLTSFSACLAAEAC